MRKVCPGGRFLTKSQGLQIKKSPGIEVKTEEARPINLNQEHYRNGHGRQSQYL